MKRINTRELQRQTRKVRELLMRGATFAWENRRRVIAYITPVQEFSDRPVVWPDVMARLKKQFGWRVFADSRSLLGGKREERF